MAANSSFFLYFLLLVLLLLCCSNRHSCTHLHTHTHTNNQTLEIVVAFLWGDVWIDRWMDGWIDRCFVGYLDVWFSWLARWLTDLTCVYVLLCSVERSMVESVCAAHAAVLLVSITSSIFRKIFY